MISGYFKKHLRVDLSKGQTEIQELSDDFLRQYVGGRGFGAKLVWDNLRDHDWKIDPMSEDNLLVLASGPLTGTYIPSSGKSSFISISPSTGVYGDSSMGGSFGVEMRQTGIDSLSIYGKSDILSILFIDDDEIQSIPMPQLRGKTCLETEGMIKEYR